MQSEPRHPVFPNQVSHNLNASTVQPQDKDIIPGLKAQAGVCVRWTTGDLLNLPQKGLPPSTLLSES